MKRLLVYKSNLQVRGMSFAMQEGCRKTYFSEVLPMLKDRVKRVANVRWGLAALILGLPLPFVLLAFLFGGCGR